MHTTDTQCAENVLLWITKYSRIVSTQNDQTFQVSKWRKHFAPVLVVYIRSFQSWRFSWVNDGDIRERHPKLGVWSLHIYIHIYIYTYIHIYIYIHIFIYMFPVRGSLPPPPTWYGPKTCVLQHSAWKRCICSVFAWWVAGAVRKPANSLDFCNQPSENVLFAMFWLRHRGVVQPRPLLFLCQLVI